jgi:hypothetical protein
MTDNCPTTKRSGDHQYNCAELPHRIAVANQLALAVKPFVDDLRRTFPEHPAVVAFDDYAEVTINAEIRRQLKDNEVVDAVEIRQTYHCNSIPRHPMNWPYAAEETEKK